jgi:hypothetical protein
LHGGVDLADTKPHNSTTCSVSGKPTIGNHGADGSGGDAEVLGSLQNGDVLMP